MAAGDIRNAEAIIFASNPSTACSINGARTPASMAGCAQANINARRRSGISASAAVSKFSAQSRTCPVAASPMRCRRTTSITFRRATVRSHASGFAGHPFSGQSASAEANASDRASSAAATSRVWTARKATSLP